MVSSLIDVAIVILQLLMFKVCRITELSKIVFFSFFPGLQGLNTADTMYLKMLGYTYKKKNFFIYFKFCFSSLNF